MGETTDDLMNEVRTDRAQLGDDIARLEEKLKDTVDGRKQLRRHPIPMVVLGATVLLSSILLVARLVQHNRLRRLVEELPSHRLGRAMHRMNERVRDATRRVSKQLRRSLAHT